MSLSVNIEWMRAMCDYFHLRRNMHVLHHNLNLVSNVLEEQYVRLKADLNQWRVETVDKIEAIYRKTLINLDTSYERLNNFRRTLDVLLDEEHLLDQHRTK